MNNTLENLKDTKTSTKKRGRKSKKELEEANKVELLSEKINSENISFILKKKMILKQMKICAKN